MEKLTSIVESDWRPKGVPKEEESEDSTRRGRLARLIPGTVFKKEFEDCCFSLISGVLEEIFMVEATTFGGDGSKG